MPTKRSDEEVLREIETAFAANPAPEQFVDRSHCSECAEHDDTLGSFTPRTIGVAQLGNPGWDPICYVSVAGFKYYFPALVRLALTTEGEDAYLDSFLFHVTYEGTDSRFFQHFKQAERKATLKALSHIRELLDVPEPHWSTWPTKKAVDDAVELWRGLCDV